MSQLIELEDRKSRFGHNLNPLFVEPRSASIDPVWSIGAQVTSYCVSYKKQN